MTPEPLAGTPPDPPAMGERRARWGYGYQDKVATDRILRALRKDLRQGVVTFEGARLADLDAGRVDDFVLVSSDSVEGNSIKWSGEATAFNWGELVGTSGLLRDLADGWTRLRTRWPGRAVTVRLQTNRPASIETHPAQLVRSISLSEFVATHWNKGLNDAESTLARDAWHTIATHVSLSASDLPDFVAHCELAFGQPEPPGGGPDSQDWRHYQKQFDSLHKAIATWLTNNPSADFIEREYLLSAIGLRANRAGLIQRFPEPDIPYEKNHASAERFKNIVDGLPGGYVAVVGAAGVGKSTLVQDVLTDSTYPFFVPYYAFLPNTDGNRDRAEALTFFQDVVGRLDRLDTVRYSLGVADIAQGRDALRRHMASANARYVLHGHKTIVLIDGLDHVMREVHLHTSILHELPRPEEIPDGVIIVLSGQPQAFVAPTIPAAVAAAVATPDKRVEVSGLSRHEIHTLVSKLAKSTTGDERDAIFDASLGNPLILTYLVSLFERDADASVSAAIELAGRYEGRIDQYYQERLAVPLQDGSSRELLGLLSRAAPTLPVAWLAEWPEKRALEDLYQRVLAPFVRIDDGTLTFIHDSLIAFLRSETRSRLPGTDPAVDERRFHSLLADRSEGRSCLDPVGRARVVHLMRAGRHLDVLAQLSSRWLRSAVEGFLPYDHVHLTLLAGYTSALAVGDWGHVLRLVLLSFELAHRAERLDASRLADALLALDEPLLGLSQIRSGGRLLVDNEAALTFAGSLWWHARARERSDLTAEARALYLQSKPIALIYAPTPIETSTHSKELQEIRAWSRVAPLFEKSTIVAQEICRVALSSKDLVYNASPADVTAGLLFSALDAALAAGRDFKESQAFIDLAHTTISNAWRFCMLLRQAESRPSDVPLDVLRAAYSPDTNNDIALAYAWFLRRQGDRLTATEVVMRLPHVRFAPHREQHSWGFSDITYTIRLRWLQDLLGLPEGPVPGVTDERDEASGRVEHTARRLGQLRALAERGTLSDDLYALFRSLLLFHNRPIAFDALRPHHDFVLHTSRTEIYEQTTKLARAIGPAGLRALKAAVLDLTSGPGAAQFTPQHRRLFAKQFYDDGLIPREEASALGLSSTADSVDDDPTQRQQASLEIAAFLHDIEDDAAADTWKKRASEVSAGAGSHKDYHMSYVGDWLARSIPATDAHRLTVLDQFVRAVDVAGGRGGSDGAATVLQLLVRIAPGRSFGLATEYLDRAVLNVSEVLAALIEGGETAHASPALLSAIYRELLSLIAPDDTSNSATAALRGVPVERQHDAASRLMASVRTNALPSHRAPVARALADALRTQGIEDSQLTKGLQPGHDDSSRKNTLYRLSNGDVDTLTQVAHRLSDPTQQDAWNPNPGENTEFDWWAAIKLATVRDEAHLELLLARFPPRDYRQVEFLVHRAEVFLNSGRRDLARATVERALALARDGSWFYWFDGAQKLGAYRTLIRLDHAEGLRRAREQFSHDLSAGKLSLTFLLSDIGGILDVLEIQWPADAVVTAIGDYCQSVLVANRDSRQYESLNGVAPPWSADEALCRFVADFLAFPVVDVAVAARRALATYMSADGQGLVALLTSQPWWNPIQLEHLLSVVHMGSASPHLVRLRGWIESLNRSDSLAVRSIAKRIAEQHGWVWQDVTTDSAHPVILLAGDAAPAREAGMLVDGDMAIGWELHQALIRPLEHAGVDAHELRSEFSHVYRALERDYPWADDDRLKRWMRLLLARFWLSPRALIGREAAMRVLGRRALSGQVPPGAEDAYDLFYPIYDPLLDLHEPIERPEELRAMEWRITGGEGDRWLRGEHADQWEEYPDSIDGLTLIGERTWLTTPEWHWPREDRFRGLLTRPVPEARAHRVLESTSELTYQMYMTGRGQNDHQLIVLNPESQLAGPAYRWAAFNARVARALGWHASPDVPFHWLDTSGNLMVKSTYWKDGWTSIEPPRFEALGEGWYVSASPPAIEAIRRFAPGTSVHIWIERHSHGDHPYEGRWHLSRQL